MSSLEEKILDLPALLAALSERRRRGERVAFTNGCFDLLHPGHVLYLEAARGMADLLVVGLNSDASVQRLKGPTRPFLSERERALVLAGLRSVDYVVLFSEDTPADLIAAIVPDVLAKGGDWAVEAIVGGDVVRAAGGSVVSIPYVDGVSTTGIAERVLRSRP
jgi:D-beta-D-heptose 7-phosphate kinase/D-beta-D-heptose 1-phosphate adenosyltransferase